MPKIKFSIITLFPEALQPYLDSSMLYKAQARGIIEVEYVNLRDFGLGPHKSVDDTPYGGGDGMLLRCEPVFAAVESIKAQDPSAEVILPTPVGQTWNQSLVRQFAGLGNDGAEAEGEQGCWPGALATQRSDDGVHDLSSESEPSLLCEGGAEAAAEHAAREPREDGRERRDPSKTGEGSDMSAKSHHYIILCPHYEGYDQRIMTLVDYPISLGNYILTGGELPALIIIDSITRLLPGVLGGATSAEIESFSDGDNLEFPQYTKPAEFRGLKVPEVLLSGDHGKVDQWRATHSGHKTSK